MESKEFSSLKKRCLTMDVSGVDLNRMSMKEIEKLRQNENMKEYVDQLLEVYGGNYDREREMMKEMIKKMNGLGTKAKVDQEN